MSSRFESFEQLEHTRKKFSFATRQFERKEMHVAIEKRGDVFGGGRDFVFLQDADNDSGIGHPGDFDIVEIVVDFEALFESKLERLNAGAAGMNQGAVDVEKKKTFLFVCHVERSRDICRYF